MQDARASTGRFRTSTQGRRMPAFFAFPNADVAVTRAFAGARRASTSRITSMKARSAAGIRRLLG